MTELNRALELAGVPQRSSLVVKLNEDLQNINAAYQSAIACAEEHGTVTEGVFNTLAAAFDAALDPGKKIKFEISKKIKDLGKVYKQKKAVRELDTLTKELQSSLDDFKKLEAKLPTILKQDPEIKDTFEIFGKVYDKLIGNVVARKRYYEDGEKVEAKSTDQPAETPPTDEPAQPGEQSEAAKAEKAEPPKGPTGEEKTAAEDTKAEYDSVSEDKRMYLDHLVKLLRKSGAKDDAIKDVTQRAWKKMHYPEGSSERFDMKKAYLTQEALTDVIEHALKRQHSLKLSANQLWEKRKRDKPKVSFKDIKKKDEAKPAA